MSTNVRRLLGAVLCLMPVVVLANPANGDPRLEKLFNAFIAPCCWRENLLVHQSPKADELRAEIRRDVAAGRSDEDIKASLVGAYSLRILSMPEGARSQWLQWTPIVGLAFGFCALTLFLRRSLAAARRSAPSPAETVMPTHLAEIEDFEGDRQ